MSTPTIGIITIHNSPSYGACLQAYALWKYISEQGYKAEIIDLLRPHNKEYIHSKKHLIYSHLFNKRKTLGDIPYAIMRKLVKTFKQQIRPNTNYKSLQKERFNEFNAQVAYSKIYRGPDELYACPPQYDIYISGSDQVWNPAQPYPVEPYFLTFVKEGKRIAYASSIGLSSIPEELKDNYKEWWTAYDDLLVRENRAKEIIRDLTGRKAEVVLDPTFLPDTSIWENFAKEPRVKGYIMLFSLGNDSKLISYGKKLAKKNNLKLVILGHNFNNIYANPIIVTAMDAGPREFLGWIKNAQFVLTDSFHCSVFSILFGTNFYAYIAKNNKRGSRIIDLLDTFSLSSHLLTKIPEDTNFPQKPDKVHLASLILDQQERSRSVLNRALAT